MTCHPKLAKEERHPATTDSAADFEERKSHSLLGNFPGRIASNAENSPISQRGCTSPDSPETNGKSRAGE